MTRRSISLLLGLLVVVVVVVVSTTWKCACATKITCKASKFCQLIDFSVFVSKQTKDKIILWNVARRLCVCLHFDITNLRHLATNCCCTFLIPTASFTFHPQTETFSWNVSFYCLWWRSRLLVTHIKWMEQWQVFFSSSSLRYTKKQQKDSVWHENKIVFISLQLIFRN